MRPRKRNIKVEIAIMVGITIFVTLFFLHYGMNYTAISKEAFARIAAGEENVNTAFFFPSVTAAMNSMTAHIITMKLFTENDYVFKCIIWALFLCAVGYLYYTVNSDIMRRQMPFKEKGSSKFQDDIQAYNKKYRNMENDLDNIILSDEIYLSMDGHKTRRNCNVFIMGSSGSGKSRFEVKPNILQAHENSKCSYVITDPSGELLESEGKFLESVGYKVKVFNLVDMKHSNNYNPFEYIRDDNGVMMLVNCLIKNTTPPNAKSGDPFWEKTETALLSALVFYLKDHRPKEERNFTSVMKLLLAAEVDENNPNLKSELDKIFDKVEKEFGKDDMAVKNYHIFKMGAGKTLKSILISCSVRLTTFNLEDVRNLTSTDNISLMDIGDEKTALFVVIPAADDTFNFLVSMMYSQLFESLYYHAEMECPNYYYIKNGNLVLDYVATKAGSRINVKNEAEKILKSMQKSKVRKEGEQFVVVYGTRKKTFATEKLAKDFVEAAKKAKVTRGVKELPYHVRFLLDEFANIGEIPQFTKKLATMRKYQISCTIIVQNLAQIKNMYKDDWDTLLGNCDSQVFLGGSEYSTVEYISKILGTATIITKNRSKSRSAKGGSGSQSFNKDQRELMKPDELAKMDNSQCIVLIRGEQPFRTPKFRLERHKNFKLSADGGGERFDIHSVQNHNTTKSSVKERRKEAEAKEFIPSQSKVANGLAGKPQQLSDKLENKTKHEVENIAKSVTPVEQGTTYKDEEAKRAAIKEERRRKQQAQQKKNNNSSASTVQEDWSFDGY